MADGDTYLIPVEPGLPHPLGRAGVYHDPRNRQYRALTGDLPDTPPRTRPWFTVDVYDQSAESSCTAQAAVGVCRTQPNTTRFTSHRKGYDQPGERYDLYRAAQLVDPWPDNQEGSSTDAPFRVLRDRGHITGWRWLFGVDEVREWVEHHGPAAVGTAWHRDMFTPDRAGIIRPTGPVVGGHAYRLTFYDRRRGLFQLVNSWGRGWARAGRAFISDADLAALLANDGEAVVVA